MSNVDYPIAGLFRVPELPVLPPSAEEEKGMRGHLALWQEG